MDLTSASPHAFLNGEEGSALMDEEMEFDENDDMDVTEVLPGDILRRRSLAIRQPFAPVRPRDSIVFPSDDAIPSDDDENSNEDSDQGRSVTEDESQVQSEAKNIQEGMDFTVPMGQSLRPPPTEDPVWLALRQVTHSGDTPHEPEASSEDDIQVDSGQQGMDLNDAMARLMRARDSMGTSTGNTTEDMDVTNAHGNLVVEEDSLLSTDDSLNDDMLDGNETLNVSKVVGRLSLGGNARMSLGYQDSTMDESGIYGSIQPLSSSTPRLSIAPPLPIEESEDPVAETQTPGDADAPLRPPVFQVPSQDTTTSSMSVTTTVQGGPPTSSVFTFVPPSATPAAPRTPTKPTSPVKPKPKPMFSAAFAPPVTKPSPKKASTSSTPIHGTPNKRQFSVMQDGAPDSGRPSPAKRPALAQKPAERLSMGTPRKGPTPSTVSLSPNKRPARNGSSNLPVPAKRQSGYFARRKSLGNALTLPQSDRRDPSPTPNFVSPARRISNGRVSLGSAPAETWKRFDKNGTAPSIPTIVLPPEDHQFEQADINGNLVEENMEFEPETQEETQPEDLVGILASRTQCVL
jgi:kinetochore protein Spc7/SPC105